MFVGPADPSQAMPYFERPNDCEMALLSQAAGVSNQYMDELSLQETGQNEEYTVGNDWRHDRP